jgi:hypothetical protein
MPTKLERLLESIDPSRTFDVVSARVDQAVNSFAMRRATIKGWDEYRNFLADFFRHVETVVLRMSGGAPEDREIYWARCSNILKDEFGPSGFKVAFDLVSTGKEGGLYRVLKTIAEKMAEEYAQNEISGRISAYLENLTVDEELAAADEYLKKYGHLLPPEFTDGSAPRLKAHFGRILKEHPKIIRRTRRIGR